MSAGQCAAKAPGVSSGATHVAGMQLCYLSCATLVLLTFFRIDSEQARCILCLFAVFLFSFLESAPMPSETIRRWSCDCADCGEVVEITADRKSPPPGWTKAQYVRDPAADLPDVDEDEMDDLDECGLPYKCEVVICDSCTAALVAFFETPADCEATVAD